MGSWSQQKLKQQDTITIKDNSYIQSFHLFEVQKAILQCVLLVWFFEEHGIL